MTAAPPHLYPETDGLLREALLRMEHACEQLAATRSHAIYTAMIDGGQAQELLELDNARRAAREVLRAPAPDRYDEAMAAIDACIGKVPQPGSVAQGSQDAADAARYRYLKLCRSYYYPEGHNPPCPREFGIEWHWQDGSPERADIDTLIDREIEEKRALFAADEDEGVSLTSTDGATP